MSLYEKQFLEIGEAVCRPDKPRPTHYALEFTLFCRGGCTNHQKTLLDEYTQLVTPVVQPVNGYFTAPETPGIGVDFTEYVREHADIETVR